MAPPERTNAAPIDDPDEDATAIVVGPDWGPEEWAPPGWVAPVGGLRVFKPDPAHNDVVREINQCYEREANSALDADERVPEELRRLAPIAEEGRRRHNEFFDALIDETAYTAYTAAVTRLDKAVNDSAEWIGTRAILRSFRRNYLAERAAPWLMNDPPEAVGILINADIVPYDCRLEPGETMIKFAGIERQHLERLLSVVTDAQKWLDHDERRNKGGAREDVKLNKEVARLRALHTSKEFSAVDICERLRIPCDNADHARRIVRRRAGRGDRHWEQELGDGWKEELKRRHEAKAGPPPPRTVTVRRA